MDADTFQQVQERLKSKKRTFQRKDIDPDQPRARLQKAGSLDMSFGIALNTVTSFLANPSQLWDNGNFEQKRGTLRLVFADKLTYNRDRGFGTTPKTLPFRLLEQNDNQVVWCTNVAESWNQVQEEFQNTYSILVSLGFKQNSQLSTH